MSGMPIRRQLRMGHKLREQRWHCSPGSVQRTNFTYQVDGVVGAPNFPILPTATLYARMLWYILYMNYGPELDVFQSLQTVLPCQVYQSMLHSNSILHTLSFVDMMSSHMPLSISELQRN